MSSCTKLQGILEVNPSFPSPLPLIATHMRRPPPSFFLLFEPAPQAPSPHAILLLQAHVSSPFVPLIPTRVTTLNTHNHHSLFFILLPKIQERLSSFLSKTSLKFSKIILFSSILQDQDQEGSILSSPTPLSNSCKHLEQLISLFLFFTSSTEGVSMGHMFLSSF